MRQLVELHKHTSDLKQLNTEVIVVFREEKKEVAGLKLIKKNTKVEFTLLIDLDAKHTNRYSPGKKVFDSFVIDSKGMIRGIIKGSTYKRAKTEQLLKVLKKIARVDK